MVASAKKDIHPELVPAKVICNGEEVAELTGTQSEYHVEVWSGNHPFYKGDGSALVVDEGQVYAVPGVMFTPLVCQISPNVYR